MLGSLEDAIIGKARLEDYRRAQDNPARSQAEVLESLLKAYEKTEAWSEKAGEVKDLKSYKLKFKVLRYKEYKSILRNILQGRWKAGLDSAPLYYAASSRTRGPPKLIPVTTRDLSDRIVVSARALALYGLSTSFEYLAGYVLSLHPPSIQGLAGKAESKAPYGHISGMHARLITPAFSLKQIPTPELVDRLGLKIGRKWWVKLYNMALGESAGKEVSFTVSSPIPLYMLARYVERRINRKVSSMFDFSVIFLSGVPDIHMVYKPFLKHYWRKADVVELYGACEGAFGVQEGPTLGLKPMYDIYFYEVKCGGKVKPLYMLERGQHGSLIVSTSVLPRYEIGDIVVSLGKGKFRVLGRNTLQGRLKAFIPYKILSCFAPQLHV